jgi:hypothetical protein
MGNKQAGHFVAFMGILGCEQKSHRLSIADLPVIVHQIHHNFHTVNLEKPPHGIFKKMLDFLK